MSEECFVCEIRADSRFHFGLEMLNVSLVSLQSNQTQVFVVVHIFYVRTVQSSDASRSGSNWLKSMHLVLLAF